jgi:glycosyltransferase involved in cell wall biosynthesis
MSENANISLPKISIIIPTKNSENTISECLESIINQNYNNFEIIILDGISTDNTIKIIENYVSEYPEVIKFFSEIDYGIYDAMNKGIDLVSGTWIYFMGSDDVFYSNSILSDIFTIDSYYNYDMIYGNVEFLNSKKFHGGKFSKFRIINENICHQAIFTKKNIFNVLGKFETKYKTYADWVFNIQLFGNNKFKLKYINKTIAVFNENGFSSNRNDNEFQKDKFEIYKKNFSVITRNLNLRKRKFPFNLIVKVIEFIN